MFPMMEEKEQDRSRRKKRRSQQDREKGERQTAKAKEARALSKLDNEKSRFDTRIRKLIDRGYSPASIAKRLGITQRRIEMAIQAEKRSY
jgi:hypothetical protein